MTGHAIALAGAVAWAGSLASAVQADCSAAGRDIGPLKP